MNRKEIINILEMENELICFNPATGKEIHFEYVNDLNKKCYIAHQEAIKHIYNSIPIEWMKSFANERALNDGIDCYWHFWGTDLLQMIEQWRKENG